MKERNDSKRDHGRARGVVDQTLDFAIGLGRSVMRTGLGQRALRATGEVEGGARRVGEDLRVVRSDLDRVRSAVRRTSSDFTGTLARTAAALVGRRAGSGHGHGHGHDAGATRTQETTREPSGNHSHASEERRPERMAASTSNGGPMPAHVPPTPPPRSRKKGAAAKASGRKTVPGSIGQDPRWGA